MMKILISLVCLFCLIACKDEPATGIVETSDVPSSDKVNQKSSALTAADTVKLAAIDHYIASIGMPGDTGVKTQRVKFNIDSEKDFAGLTYKGTELVVVVTTLFQKDGETREFYFFDKGKLVYCKQRHWLAEGSPPMAKEVVSYFEGDKVLHALERSITLAPGENPSPLVSLPYTDSKVNRDSLRQAISANFEVFKKASGKF